ncbi:hypothetical protein [Niastella vici]|nr:hypothetical protein [Niastella vici]
MSHSTIINANENRVSSWLTRGDRADNESYALFIPVADALIAKHATQPWKNSPGDWWYQRMQFAICCKLSQPNRTRESTMNTIALFLECHLINLYNDPEFKDL